MDALMIIVIGIPLGLLTTLILMYLLLLEPIRRMYGYFVDVHRNVQRLSLYMNLLVKRRVDLPPDTQGPAREWADGVSSLMQKVDDFQHQYENWMQMAVFSSLILRYRIAQSAGFLLEEVEDYGSRPLPPAVEELHHVNNVFGQQRILDEALRYIQDSQTKVIGIYGAGGVGKTTLLFQINNYLVQRPDQASSNHAESRATKDYGFDHVVWATVSREINHKNLQEDIAHCLGLTLSHEQSLEERADDIRNFLIEKRFLVLLDDLWELPDLNKLGIPNPDFYEDGSQFRRKWVFTTRFKNVSRSAWKMIKVPFMSEDHAWQLFTRMLFVQCDGSNLDIAKDIAKQCGGLPVALKAIGQAMSSRRSFQEWEDAVELLKNSQPIHGMENMMLSLEQTYNTLSDDKIKECFLCCGLWPKGFSIDKNELIQCWMGMGLLDDSHHVGKNYEIGRKYIKTLKKTGLLEVGDNKHQEVKMHNVIRIMALDIAFRKHNWIVQAGVGLQQAPSDAWHWAAAESISLMFNEITTLPDFERDHKFPKLSTLMLQHSSLDVIPNTFFPCMPKLTYLDLSHTYSLTELPGEICLLTELRYINLSITGIRSLPPGLEKLNLRCLILRDTRNLESLSPSMIPSTLQLLDAYGSSGVLKTVEGSPRRSLKKTITKEETYPKAVARTIELEGDMFTRLTSLQVLNVSLRSTEILFIFSMLSRLQLRCIAIGDNTALEILDLNVEYPSWEHVQELKIFNLVRLKFLHMDLEKGWPHRKLQVLHLDSLQELKEIVCSARSPSPFLHPLHLVESLPRLWSLSISGCGKLDNVSWASRFWLLKYLRVSSCLRMTKLFDDFRFGRFGRLKTLHLEQLPNLESIYPGREWVFPSIVNITVDGCPKLRSLPLQRPPDRIEEIKGDQEWWDGLQWEDDTIRVSLQTYFVPIPNRPTTSTASTSRWDPL